MKHPKNDVKTCEDFFITIVEAHVLAAAMELLGMNSLASVPSSDLIAEDYWVESAEQRHTSLMTVCEALVSKFINFKFLATRERQPKPKQKQSKDKVFEYACHVLSLGLFYIEFLDTIREGDGTRLQRCWRYLLPLFKATNRKNYALEALYMLYQCQYVLSPRLSHQLLWSRFINTRGRRGHNIPCDLFNEHLNRLVKEAVGNLRANQTGKATVRVSWAIGTLHPVIEQFDQVNSLPTLSGAHFKPKADKDRNLLLEEIDQREHVFRVKPAGRKHKTFPHVKPLLQHKPKVLMKWMNGHIKKMISLKT